MTEEKFTEAQDLLNKMQLYISELALFNRMSLPVGLRDIPGLKTYFNRKMAQIETRILKEIERLNEEFKNL